MKERIKDKMKEIEEFMAFLSERIPQDLESYKKDLEKKAICERYVEKIIEAIVDLSFLTARLLDIELPAQTADTEIFDILKNRNIISEALCKKLKEAKGMRNWLAHEYGRIDDEIVYNSISEELEKDVNEFIEKIRENLK